MSSDTLTRHNVPLTLGVDSTEEDSSYSLSGKIMVSVILILFFVVVFLITLHFYVKSRLLRARRRQLSRRSAVLIGAHDRRLRHTRIVFTTTTNTSSGNRGLESSVLSSLPVFVFSEKTHPEPLDCAVCLSEFEESEKGRFLPKCNHSFHIECIDMWFHSHSTCPLCRAPVEPVIEPDNKNIGSSERTEIEPTGSSSGLCVACEYEEGNSSTTSLRSRRKGLDVTIDVPARNELEDELTLSSVGGSGSRSPGTRLLSARMKRLLSMGGRKTPTSVRSTTPFGVETSNRMGETDLEKGRSELTPR